MLQFGQGVLTENQNYGFHIHNYGVYDNNCDSTGGHYNPENKNHGAPTDEERHVGSLGNIMLLPGQTELSFDDPIVQL